MDPARVPAPLNPVVRALLLAVGIVTLVLGVVGVFVPVLPTTPFLLIAAACFARASTRLYGWLLGQRTLGPIVAEWRRSRSLPPGAKARALAVVVVTFTLSVVLVEPLALKFVLLAGGIVLVTFLYRLPTATPAAD